VEDCTVVAVCIWHYHNGHKLFSRSTCNTSCPAAAAAAAAAAALAQILGYGFLVLVMISM
jgi:hypothetical protein